MGIKVALAGVLITVALVGGGWLFMGTGDNGGFGEGVQKSELCREEPDHWWCKLWDGK